jgi:hypothetical protein
MKPQLVDQQLIVSLALPNGAAVVTSTAIDLTNSAKGDFVGLVQFTIAAPALATGVLADGAHMTYDVYHAASADLSDGVALYPGVLVQTGAGGAGAAAATFEFRVPTNVKRYVYFKATNSGAGNASALSATLTPKF